MREFKNYMFFANLKQIARDIDKIMSLDKKQIDEMISNGHDWAGEHVTTAKDDIEEVTNFLLGHLSEGDKPYSEEIDEYGIITRTFAENINPSELEWHRDKEDRVVKAVNENDWMIQFDNDLPRKINLNEEITIPKETFHRVIKGTTDLVVEIIESSLVLEKDDRCTRIAKRKYDTWPSAYASGAVVRCRKGEIWKDVKEEEEVLNEKTDYSKEKDKGLHGWFERQGGEGKSSGWVDCNTCRKDSKTGRKKCKPCGREKGEDRAKYPACRPTPSACGTKGKGKKWGKKSKKNEDLQISENNGKFVETDSMKDIITAKLHEATAPAPAKPKVDPKVKPSPKRKKIWETKPVVKPKPKMEEGSVMVMSINGKEVDKATLEIDGCDTGDYPDWTDAYFSYAEYIDGTPLSDEELDQLSEAYYELLSQMCYEKYI